MNIYENLATKNKLQRIRAFSLTWVIAPRQLMPKAFSPSKGFGQWKKNQAAGQWWKMNIWRLISHTQKSQSAPSCFTSCFLVSCEAPLVQCHMPEDQLHVIVGNCGNLWNTSCLACGWYLFISLESVLQPYLGKAAGMGGQVHETYACDLEEAIG